MGEKFRADTPARRCELRKVPVLRYINVYHELFKPLNWSSPPSRNPTLCWGVRGHQHARDESIQVPHKTQPPKTLYSHPQDHAFSTRSQTPKENKKSSTLRKKRLTFIQWTAWFWHPKSQKSLNRICVIVVSPTPSFPSMRFSRYKGFKASKALLCLLMNVHVNIHTTRPNWETHSDGTSQPRFLHIFPRFSVCKPCHATIRLIAIILR